MMKKKAQQEIAGFVIIVVLVSIVGLLFLSLMLGRGESTLENNAEISYFLDASMYYTTECVINFIPQYQNLEDLIKKCYEGNICLNQIDSCRILNETFKDIIQKGLKIGVDSPNKAYTLNIYYAEENSTEPSYEILTIAEGEFKACNSKTGGVVSRSYGRGHIETELEVCKGG